MAETLVREPPAKAGNPELPGAWEDISHIEVLCKVLGMDVNARNKLEHVAKLPMDFTAVPSGTDVNAMRVWINETFLQGPLAEARSKCDIKRRLPEVPVDISNITIPCSDGSGTKFTIRRYLPRSAESGADVAPRPAILMLHGGGWIHGKPEGDEVFSAIFASELRAVVLGVDYRLAPEHPFPAGLDDCCEALRWVTRHASEYNIDPNRIAVWGASAGGNLAAALAIRESQLPPQEQCGNLRLVSLVVPAIAHPKVQTAFERARRNDKSSNENLFASSSPASDAEIKEFEKLYEMYTGGQTEVFDPLVSPLMATVDSRHAPTHFTVAACDLLKFQDLAYAQHLRTSGVKVTEEILPGVPHGFTFPLNAKVTLGWLERQVSLLAAVFEDKPT